MKQNYFAEVSTKIISKIIFIPTMFILMLFLIPGMTWAAENLNQGFIYGKITMRDGETYMGVIRWGKEEALWTDMFNSNKEENEFVDYLSAGDLRKLRRKYRGDRKGINILRIFKIFRDDSDDIVTHQFSCRFGDIQKMKFIGSDTVRLTFKNGERYEVSGGSNDINTRINVFDEEAGEMSLKWRRVRSIEFMPVPQGLTKKFGNPIYGTVNTEYGEFTGWIQWDHQECLSTDKLDGEGKDSDMSIEFGDIKAIEKYRRGSMVTLNSGKEYYLYDTNDVDDDNRGIVINDLRFGKVLVEWDEFVSVEFDHDPKVSIPAYEDFLAPKQLTGTVTTREGKVFMGRIVYDLDEAMDYEMLDGYADDIEYHFPFRNIGKIVPKGRHYSKITLKNGKTLELEDERDVNRSNDGVLVWEDEDPIYIPWREIREIEFKD
jgi:hypothetical protein